MSAPGPIKILLVDDRPANLLALEAALASPQYELVKAQSGAEALRFLLKNDCALILMDVNMPGMDGYETARLVRQNERTRAIPIVFITALSEDETRVVAGYQSGAIDYLRKPIQPEVLRSKVAGFAALHRARLEIQRQAELLRAHEQREHAHALAELELRALRRQQVAQRRYQTLIEGLSQAIVWTLEPLSHSCTFASPSAGPLLGFALQRWTEEPGFWLARLPQEDREQFVRTAAGLTPGGPAAKLEHRLIRADGSVAFFESTFRLLGGDEPEPARLEVQGLSVDVTEAVESRSATAFLARASDELSRSLEVRDIAAQAVGMAAGPLADWASVDVEGFATVACHARPELQRAAQAAAERFARSGRVAAAEPTLVENPLQVDGTAGPERLPLQLECAGALVLPLSARGRRLGTLCLFSREAGRFLARRREVAGEFARRLTQSVENALLHARTEAAVRAREEFLSIASHELRTPLTALHLQVQMLRSAAEKGGEGASGDDLQRRLAVLARQIDRLTALVNTLLDLARIRSERLSLDVAPCDLADVVRDAAARFEEVLAAGGRALVVEIADGLVGRWDRTRLEQLLTNLIGNAVKHGGRGAVTVQVRRAEASAVLRVADAGPGIPESEQARIFEPFAQGRDAGRGGLGLGLYIARSIAEAHGGRISLESAAGHGTTFHVQLPLAPAFLAVPSVERPALSPVPAPQALTGQA
ncbi:MAG TPA: ATP-binding protein [Anaeromyxobacteraceae bacterium]